MTDEEYKDIVLNAYKKFIETNHGRQAIDSIELAIRVDMTNRLLEKRDTEQFNKELAR